MLTISTSRVISIHLQKSRRLARPLWYMQCNQLDVRDEHYRISNPLTASPWRHQWNCWQERKTWGG